MIIYICLHGLSNKHTKNLYMKRGLIVLLVVFFLAHTPKGFSGADDLVGHIASRSLPLENANHLDPLIEKAGERRLVFLGEASHGTREYYAWRDSITRRLIREKDFRFVAVEGDWAVLFELNRYVKHRPGAASSARGVLQSLQRWPLWMWGNEEVVALAEWMREHNAQLPYGQRVGFYGKDVYNEWHSMERVLDVLEHADEALYLKVAEHYGCFYPYRGDSWQYARDAAAGRSACDSSASAVVDLLRTEGSRLVTLSQAQQFDLKQNALVVKYAEMFYRQSLTHQDATAWNSRVEYMDITINRLLDHYGSSAKGIVWAHNTHVGDARFTEMFNFGQNNIGGLNRVRHHPDEVFLVGFSGFRGSVKAGARWGDRMQRMRVPSAPRGSIEHVFEQTGNASMLLIFDDDDRSHEGFMQPIGHRAIGVVYDPSVDNRQNYVQSVIPLRYDAMLYFRDTEALTPLIR